MQISRNELRGGRRERGPYEDGDERIGTTRMTDQHGLVGLSFSTKNQEFCR